MEVWKHFNRACAFVDLDNMLSNIEAMRRNLNPDTKIAAVIKTDGYGHGSVAIAKELEKLPYIWGYCTASKEEALQLRNNGMKKPILILGFSFPDAAEYIVDNEIRPAVFTFDMAKELSDAALTLHKKAIIHIKVDTGMGRIGVKPDEEGLSIIRDISKLPGIEIEGIFTHFARADETDKEHTWKQYSLFTEFTEKVCEEIGYRIPIRHCANSAAIAELPEMQLDMVRAGITMYGLWPSAMVSRESVSIKPLMKVVSHITYVKKITSGDCISYGGTFMATHDMEVATVPVGYGDGYPRGLSSKGNVLIKGKRCPVLGRVCMDQFMVDVTGLGVKALDEVVIIGKDGNEEITMEEAGDISGRFNYELACDLGKRIPRVYIKGGKVIAYKDYSDDVQTIYLEGNV